LNLETRWQVWQWSNRSRQMGTSHVRKGPTLNACMVAVWAIIMEKHFSLT